MATTTNRDLPTGLPAQPHRRDHVLGARTANNQARMLVHQTVMNSPNLVVARISRRHHRTSESRPPPQGQLHGDLFRFLRLLSEYPEPRVAVDRSELPSD